MPTVLGFDPRLQFLHEDDGLEVLGGTTLGDHRGIFNVAGDGVLLLSQAIRRAGRPSLPIPQPAAPWIGQALRRLGLADFSPEQMRFLSYGRVVDTSRMQDVLGFTPRYTTREAFDDFVERQGLRGPLSPDVVGAVEPKVAGRPGRPSPAGPAAVPDARVIPIGGDEPRRSSAADAVAAGASRASGERSRRRRATPLLDETAAAAEPSRPAPSAAPSYAGRQDQHAGRADRTGDRGAARRVAGAGAGPGPELPEWERKVAAGLAFVRRRLTGDYEVDEFGFDPELTEHVLLAALRPLYEHWFRVEVARHREHPVRGRRAGRRQPLRHHRRSTR